jgi:hypothetical protein
MNRKAKALQAASRVLTGQGGPLDIEIALGAGLVVRAGDRFGYTEEFILQSWKQGARDNEQKSQGTKGP